MFCLGPLCCIWSLVLYMLKLLPPEKQMEHSNKVMMELKESQISPPSGSVPLSTIPISYFDLISLADPPLHAYYFYKLQSSYTDFIQSILPRMKHSLSLSLKHYFPLAGHLVWLSNSTVPEVVYAEGDSISFTVVESSSSFQHISRENPRETIEFDMLSTQLIPQSSATSGIKYPLLALRVTLFPNSGICVGVSMSHVIADPMALNNFMKYWSSVCSLGGETSSILLDLLPSLNKSSIVDTHGIENYMLNNLKKSNISQRSFILPLDTTRLKDPNEMKVVSDFIIDLPNIEKLKKLILKGIVAKTQKKPCFDITALIVVYAHMWVCLIKAFGGNNVDDNSNEYFVIPIDCRTLIRPALPLTYFGNCITLCPVRVCKNDLVSENGIVLAAEAIGNAITTLLHSKDILGPLKSTLEEFFELAALGSERIAGVSWSSKINVYDVDFGFGIPRKVEFVWPSLYSYELMVIRENSIHANGGLEVEVALKKQQMKTFTSIFKDILSNL